MSEAILLFAAYSAAIIIDPAIFLPIYLFYEDGLAQIATTSAVVLIAMYFLDLYSRFAVRSKIEMTQLTALSFGIAFLAEAALAYVWVPLSMPAEMMINGTLIAIPGLVIWRIIYSNYIIRLAESLIFVGSNSAVYEISREIQARPELGLRNLGYIADEPDSLPVPELYLGSVSELKRIVSELRPDRLIVGFTDRRGRLPVYDLLDLRFSGVVIQETSTMFEATCSRLSIASLHPSELIFSGRFSPGRRSEMVHAITDVIVAGFATILLLPVMILVAIAVKVTSRGPVFFRQPRIGRYGAKFDMLKFRTMYETPAEPVANVPWDPLQDPRVTPVGKILRTLRINEMPQLLNVLKREMSVVGPRPERPEYVQVFQKEIPFYGHRHSVRPGITGWAQINYGHADTVQDTIRKLEYDLYYIKNMSNALDLYIMFHTAKTVLLARDSG